MMSLIDINKKTHKKTSKKIRIEENYKEFILEEINRKYEEREKVIY